MSKQFEICKSKSKNGTRCPEGYVFPAGMPHPLQFIEPYLSIFQFTDDMGYCNPPPYRSNTNVQVVNDRNKKCTAQYSCEDGFEGNTFGRYVNINCLKNGKWPDMSFNCIEGNYFYYVCNIMNIYA